MADPEKKVADYIGSSKPFAEGRSTFLGLKFIIPPEIPEHLHFTHIDPIPSPYSTFRSIPELLERITTKANKNITQVLGVVGFPCVGKTTTIELILEYLQRRGQNAVLVTIENSMKVAQKLGKANPLHASGTFDPDDFSGATEVLESGIYKAMQQSHLVVVETPLISSIETISDDGITYHHNRGITAFEHLVKRQKQPVRLGLYDVHLLQLSTTPALYKKALRDRYRAQVGNTQSVFGASVLGTLVGRKDMRDFLSAVTHKRVVSDLKSELKILEEQGYSILPGLIGLSGTYVFTARNAREIQTSQDYPFMLQASLLQPYLDNDIEELLEFM